MKKNPTEDPPNNAIVEYADKKLKTARFMLKDSWTLVLDVRSSQEYHGNAYFEGAISIPTPMPPLSRSEREVMANRLIATIGAKMSRPVVIYCQKGIRSKIAKDILTKLGYWNVLNLGGVETQPLKDVLDRGEVL